MVTKKKAKKNEDFKKVKLKVGKKLKKTATTDTTIKAKKVVLATQLEEKLDSDDKPLSFRGLTLDELSKQLGHFNKNIRNGAIVGLKQILTSRPDLISQYLRTLIPSISRLLNDNTLESHNQAQLKALFKVICTVPSEVMSAHISLFLAHVYRALSHMELQVRNFALSILSIIMENYPDLCRNNPDLFSSFLNFIGSSRRPAWNKPRFLDTIILFVNVYDVSRKNNKEALEIELSFEKESLKSNGNDLRRLFNQSDASPFDYPVLASGKSSVVSPFELPSALLNLMKGLSPILTTCISEDEGGAFLTQTVELIQLIVKAAENQPNDFLMSNFRQKVMEEMGNVRKAILKRKGRGEQLKKAAKWLLVE